MIQEKLNEEDCWGVPEPEPTTLLEEYQMGLITEERAQELMQPTQPIQPLKGDESLDRPLTFDEHIRRGGSFTTWRREQEEKAKEFEKLMTHYVGDSCNPSHEEIKES